ncbi:MAG: amidohydrolase family protein [Oscillospiraceae bacterium]|nr:amidohydrolase family protein [Oscillospiraceae bacterium]
MNMILKGNIIYSKTPQALCVTENGFLVCENGVSKGVFTKIPDSYSAFPVSDYNDALIIPGLCDLHTHAPQFAFRGMGMDLGLLDWLSAYTYPEEAKYSDLKYADYAYTQFASALSRSATTRACIFATVHADTTNMLMEKLESSGIAAYVGLVNMDRNCPDSLISGSAGQSPEMTQKWIEDTICRFENIKPILTPRFIPSCSDGLMERLKTIQKRFKLPVQSHLSENPDEVKWVKELCPDASSYAQAYDRFGLFGGDGAGAVMAHCVWCTHEEKQIILKNGVHVAHCPQSNVNIASGIAPIREYLDMGIRVGLGSDIAGGCHHSIFRAMSDAVQVSKLYWRLIDDSKKPLTISEAFYLATVGGGSFFGKAGSFDDGFEFDAVVIDDSSIVPVPPLCAQSGLSPHQRLERLIYLSDDNCIIDKYVRGKNVMRQQIPQ